MTIVGVDLGGTNIAAGVVDDHHRVLQRVRTMTPDVGPGAVADAIAELVGELGPRVTAVGLGAPGPIKDGIVRYAPNLIGWTEPVPLAAELEDRLGVPVVIDNDGTVGALGESVAGAGRGARFLLAVWLGTGVGGGLLLDGKPYHGPFGAAGEFGHVIVERNGAQCGCGRRGCVEAYAGRVALERAALAHHEGGQATALVEIARRRKRKRMTSGVWAEALEQRDPVAVALMDDAVDALGCAVATVINLLDLDTVVVGGGLTEKLGQALVDRIHDAARPRILMPESRRFLAAELPDDAGIVGAALLARTSLSA